MKDDFFIVYRFYSKSGCLLYIGRSIDFIKRFQNHLSKKIAGELSFIDLTRLKTKKQMIEYERQSIINEKPKYNVGYLVDRYSKLNISDARELRTHLMIKNRFEYYDRIVEYIYKNSEKEFLKQTGVTQRELKLYMTHNSSVFSVRFHSKQKKISRLLKTFEKNNLKIAL